MTKFTVALREIGTYKEVLRSQVKTELNDKLSHLLEVKEARKLFSKASLIYDQALEKFLSLRKSTKSNITNVLEEELHNARKTFEQARFNLVTALSNVEAKKRFEFLEAISGTMDAHLRYFKQGYELLHQMEPYINQESMEHRKLELRGRLILNMMIPMNVFEGPSKDNHRRVLGGESGDEVLDEEAGGSQEVQVKVLVKRGNKQQTKQMYIPRDCTLVQSTKQKEVSEFKEKQDIKRLILEYNDRVEEENNRLGAQTLNWPSVNSRAYGRGNSWEGSSNRSGGSRHRHHSHSGSGSYYDRKK